MSNIFKLPILVYHRIVSDETSLENIPVGGRPYCLSEQKFLEQLNYLLNHEYEGISVSEISGINHKKVIVITFDDGFESDYIFAFRELGKMNFRATFYIVTDCVGRKGYMNWTQIKELHHKGMEIGSHSVSHRCLLDLDRNEISRELRQSKKEIEDRLGLKVESFSIPFGFASQKIIEMAFEVGYETVCTSKARLVETNTFPRIYGRYGIRKSDSMKMVTGIIDKKPLTLLKINLMEKGKDFLKSFLGRRLWLTYRDKLLNVKS